MSKFYITTAIHYVNDDPHIGQERFGRQGDAADWPRGENRVANASSW